MNKDELAKKAWEENGKFWTHIGYFVAGYEAKESMERELYEGLKAIIEWAESPFELGTKPIQFNLKSMISNAKQLIEKYKDSQK